MYCRIAATAKALKALFEKKQIEERASGITSPPVRFKGLVEMSGC